MVTILDDYPMGTQPTLLSIPGFPPDHNPLIGTILTPVRARFPKQGPTEDFTVVGTVESSAGSFSHLQHLLEFPLGWEFTFLGGGCMRWYGIVTQNGTWQSTLAAKNDQFRSIPMVNHHGILGMGALV